MRDGVAVIISEDYWKGFTTNYNTSVASRSTFGASGMELVLGSSCPKSRRQGARTISLARVALLSGTWLFRGETRLLIGISHSSCTLQLECSIREAAGRHGF
jgi:hypothetical protein